MSQPPQFFPCPHCGNTLTYGTLACPFCHKLVYAQRLNEIAAEASREEQLNPIRAAMTWREALPLLPPDSEQAHFVNSRIGTLAAALHPGAQSQSQPLEYAPPPNQTNDPLRLALVKTIGSMLISIAVYALMFKSERGITFGLQFATGFVILILIHELGHVLAMRFFHLSASPPIFIPFLGALINLRQAPRNALEESIIGIGGPVTGTLASIAAYLLYTHTGSALFLELAFFGSMLNLFNLLPVPPLDGGRVTAAVSPWIWITGLLVAAGWVVRDYVVFHSINYIIILLLVMAWPRIKRTLIQRQRNAPYYAIGATARWAMGAAYVVLGLVLLLLYAHTNTRLDVF